MKRFTVYHGGAPFCHPNPDARPPTPAPFAEFDPHRRQRWKMPRLLVSDIPQERKPWETK